MIKCIFLSLAIFLTCCRSSHLNYSGGHFFEPGKTWLDKDKVPIQAHACGILKINATYYMYGQDQRLGHGITLISPGLLRREKPGQEPLLIRNGKCPLCSNRRAGM